MIERFLKAKHWQLFVLTFGIPMILQIIAMAGMMTQLISESESNPDHVFNTMMITYPIIMLMFIFGFLGWFWSIAIGLRNRIPVHLKMSSGYFKFSFFFIIVYLFFFAILFTRIFMSSDFNPLLLGLVFPLHFYCMFNIFYCMYFVSKTIRTIELNRKVSFGDYAGEFFLIWFYPVGIWIIQPRINKMIDNPEPPADSYFI